MSAPRSLVIYELTFFIFSHFLIRRLIKMCNVYDSNDISHSLPDVHKTSQRGKVRREDAQKCFRKLENWKRCRRCREMAKQKQSDSAVFSKIIRCSTSLYSGCWHSSYLGTIHHCVSKPTMTRMFLDWTAKLLIAKTRLKIVLRCSSEWCCFKFAAR